MVIQSLHVDLTRAAHPPLTALTCEKLRMFFPPKGINTTEDATSRTGSSMDLVRNIGSHSKNYLPIWTSQPDMPSCWLDILPAPRPPQNGSARRMQEARSGRKCVPSLSLPCKFYRKNRTRDIPILITRYSSSTAVYTCVQGGVSVTRSFITLCRRRRNTARAITHEARTTVSPSVFHWSDETTNKYRVYRAENALLHFVGRGHTYRVATGAGV